MAEISQEQLEAALAKQAETLARIINEKKGGTGAGNGFTEFTNIGTGAKEVARSLKNARDALDNYGLRSKEYTKSQMVGNFAANLFGKSTEDAAKAAQRLDSALYEQQRALETLLASGKKADDVEVKRLKNNIEGLQRTKNFHTALEQGAGVVKGALGSFAGSLVKLQQVQVNYLIGVSQAAAQGADGFVLAGKAMEAAAERANAVAHMYADMQVTVGQALMNMGGKAAPLAGAALSFLGNTAKQTADMTMQLEKNRISLMVAEGSKLIKSYNDITHNGVIFGNGIQGMVDATAGTKLRLEEMAAVVKENKEAFGASGLSMQEATKRVGSVAKIFASTSGSMAKMDRQLLALGYNYQQQAGLAADVLAISRRSATGQTLTNQQLAGVTADYAKNLSLISAITGEDAKAKMAEMQKQNARFAVARELAKMEPTKRAEFDSGMNSLDKTRQEILRDMIANHGLVVNETNAILMKQVPGLEASMKDLYQNYKTGSFNTKSVLDNQTKYNEKINKGLNGKGMDAFAQAGYLGMGVAKDAQDALTELYGFTSKVKGDTISNAEREQAELERRVKSGKEDPRLKNILDAQEAGAKAAKRLQEKVLGMLDRLASDMQRASDDAVAALDAVAPPVNQLATIVEKLLPFLIGLAILEPLLKGASALFRSAKGIPEGAPGNMPAAARQRYAAGTVIDGKKVGGQFMSNEAIAAEKAMAKEAGMFSKALGSLGKKLPLIGTGVTIALAGYELFNLKKKEDAGEISKNEANKEAGGIGFGAAGGIVGMLEGGSIGLAIGEAIGVALAPFTAGISLLVAPALGSLVGGIVGAFSGGYIGKKIGETLGEFGTWANIVVGDIGEAAGQWYDSFMAGSDEMWNSFKEGSAAMWKSVKSQWTEATTAAYGWMKKTFPGLTATVENAAAKAANFANESWNKAKEGYDSLAKSVSDLLASIGDAADKWINSVTTKVKDFLPEFLGGSEKNSLVRGDTNIFTGKKRGDERQAEINKNQTAAVQRDPKDFNKADLANVDSWVQAVIKNPSRLTEVPEVYKSEVARLTKGKIPAVSVPSATEVKTAISNTASKLMPDSPIPQKAALTAAEKAAAMETVAANTKYANDLLLAMQKTIHTDNRNMLSLLQELTGHAESTADHTKKTAARVQ